MDREKAKMKVFHHHITDWDLNNIRQFVQKREYDKNNTEIKACSVVTKKIKNRNHTSIDFLKQLFLWFNCNCCKCPRKSNSVSYQDRNTVVLNLFFQPIRSLYIILSNIPPIRSSTSLTVFLF